MAQPTPPLRQLGKYGPKIPAIGLGLMGLSVSYGEVPSDEERFKLLDRAVELGATNWDSAELASMYGDSEELLGRWFKRTGKRNEIFLATKFGFEKGSYTDINSSAKYLKEACAESLRRLGTDYIDLYYMHRANPNTPIEDTMRGLLELKAEGKIRNIGLSEVSSTTLRRACKLGHVDAVEVEYAPFELAIETEGLRAACAELGVATVAYSPLGRGMLAGLLGTREQVSGEGDMRALFPRFDGENLPINLRAVERLKALAAGKGCSAAQLCIAWLLRQGEHVFPIPGTKRIAYLEENMGALHVRVSDAEEAEIRELAAGIVGERVPDFVKSQCFVDTVEE